MKRPQLKVETLVVTVIMLLSVALFVDVLLTAAAIYTPPARCTCDTDTDCMERCGGNGDPE